MRNRKFSKRAGAWILSAAMLFNGLPVNVFAEGDEEIVSGESTDTVGETEEGSTGQDGTDTDTAQEVPQQDSQQNSQQDPQQNLQQETGDEESGFTSSEDTDDTVDPSQSGITEENVTYHDAIFQVLWSDGDNLADRRDDQDLSARFTIYQNGQAMASQPQIVLEKAVENSSGGTQLGTYRVQSLPDSDGQGTAYTYSIKENAPAGYEAFTADAFTGQETDAANALLAELISPDEELPFSIEEGEDLYKANKMFGNYLRQYAFTGNIRWNDSANQSGIRPDMESWFRDQIQITRDGATYQSFRVHYEQNAEDESVWNYQITGLFAVKEDKTQAAYQISLNVPEGYTTETGTFIVNGNQTDSQSTFDLEVTAEPTEKPEETPATEPTEEPEETPAAEPTEKPEETVAVDAAESKEAELEAFGDMPATVSVYSDNMTVSESTGSAELNIQFLDKVSKKGEEYYNQVNSAKDGDGNAVPVTLKFQIEGDQEYSVQLTHNAESGWSATGDEGALAVLKSMGLSEADLAAKATSNWTLGTGKVSLTGLPSKVNDGTAEHTVSWNLSMGTSVEGYCNAQVDASTRTYRFVPYYTNSENEEFNITIDLRVGNNTLTDDEIRAVLKKLTLSYDSDKMSAAKQITLADILEKNNLPAEFEKSQITWKYDSNKISLTVQNIPWCDTDKYEYTYSVISPDEITDSQIGIVANGDKLVPRYDNAQSSNFSSVTDRCHDNGTLYLTLTGETSYTGYKIWLDDNEEETKNNRPDATWKLWRYPDNGSDYTKASPVTTENGTQISWTIDKTADAGKSTAYGTTADAEETVILPTQSGVASLPKYDADGYPYVYLTRESGNKGYEQIYGTVTDAGDGDFTVIPNDNDPYTYGSDLLARGNDTSLYNEGTLSNRITGTTSTTVRKIWENAAHQDSIQDVTLSLTLQSTYAENPDESSWTDVKTITMSGFRSEIQEKEATEEVQEYDELGRKLTYRWIETNVSEQKSGKETATVTKAQNSDAVESFTLACNDNTDGEEWYEPEYSNENGTTVVTNRLVGETKYFIDKVWHGFANSTEDGKTAPDENKEITVILYQDGMPYKDADGNTIEYTISANSKTKDPETNEDRIWSRLIEDLPKYSPNGSKYVYYAIEKPDPDAVANYTYNVTELNKFSRNNALISNGPDGGQRIRVEKIWEDDGDTDNRLPVHVGVWRVKRTGEATDKYLGKVILTADNNWWTYFGIGAEDSLADDEYYIRELGMGSDEVEFRTKTSSTNTQNGNKTPYLQGNIISDEAVTGTGNNLESTSGAPIRDTVVDYVDTEQYRYDVTYSLVKGYNAGEDGGIFPEDTYCVTNHRYGWVNLTVTKTWTDGGQSAETRKAFGARLRLEIANPSGQLTNVSISDDGKYVIANGISYPIYGTDLQSDGNAIQEIGNTGSSGNTETIGFYNLPKFDEEGVKIRYKIVEEAPQSEGSLSFSDVTEKSTVLSEADYLTYITYGDYTVAGEKHALDTQEIEVTNKRSDTRSVVFYKLWIDQALKTKRPDIYFTLYRATDGSAPVEYGTFKPYEVSQTADSAYVTFEFRNMPEYDENGALITYYAAEGMHVEGTALDYIPVQYYYSENPVFDLSTNGLAAGLKETYLANAVSYATIGYNDSGRGNYTVENNPGSDPDDDNVLQAEDHSIVLKENGTFVNEVRSTVKVDGKKVWKNILGDFPKNQLPKLNFDLMQSVVEEDGTESTPVKVAKFDEPLGADEDGAEFEFKMRYLGINTQQGGYVSALDGSTVTDTWTQLLPKYDKNGRMYKYTVAEQYSGTESEQNAVKSLYDVSASIHSYLVNNTFKQGLKKITVEKTWEQGIDDKRPDVTFKLYRFFETRDTDGNISYTEPTVIQTKVLTNGEKTVTFEGLNTYAPDGNKCYYYIEEIVPNGYKNTGITVNGGTDTGITAENVSGVTKKGDVTSEIFTFNDVEKTTTTNTAVSFQNRYLDEQTETVTLSGQKIWDDSNDAFGTRPAEIQITLTRYAVSNTQGNTPNDIVSENVFGDGEKITLSIPTDNSFAEVSTTYAKSKGSLTGNVVEKSGMVNTYKDGITVTVKKDANNANAWSYTIVGLDKYAFNGGEWIYTIEESEVVLRNSAGEEVGRYILSGSVSSANGSVGQRDEKAQTTPVTMPGLKNTLEYTSAGVKKVWNEQQVVITQLMEAQVELWVKVGDGGYQPYYEIAGFPATTEDNAHDGNSTYRKWISGKSNTWTAEFKNLPKAIKDGDEYKSCSYIVVEKAIRYKTDGTDTAKWLKLNPTWNASTGTIEYAGSTGRYTIATELPGTDSTQTTITNTLNQKTSISFEKKWEGDSANKYSTRPASIRVKLQRRIAGTTDYTDVAVWNMTIDTSTGKLKKNQNANLSNGNWKVDADGIATISGLPRYTKEGDPSSAYEYRVIEVAEKNGALKVGGKDADDNDVVASTGSASASGSYYIVSYSETRNTDSADDAINCHTVITNTAKTTSLAVTKTWADDDTSFRPDNLSLTLRRYKLDKNGKKVSGSDENVTTKYSVTQPDWTKDAANTWSLTYTDLPQYYGAYAAGGKVIGLAYYYYVTEDTQPGYLSPKYQNPTAAKDDATGAVTVDMAETITNKAVVLQLDKADPQNTDGNKSIRKALTITLTGADKATEAYKATWSRDENGVESVSVEKKAGDGTFRTIYTAVAADNSTHVDIKGLPIGTYTLTENPPEGYESVPTGISITLVDAGNGTLSIQPSSTDVIKVTPATAAGTSSAVLVTVNDTRTSLEINKISSLDGKTLTGFEFKVTPYSADDYFVDRNKTELFITSSSNGTIGQLIAGRRYVLEETKAPDGYILPTNNKVTFTLDIYGNILTTGNDSFQAENYPSGYVTAGKNSGTFTIKNDPIQITLLKTDSEDAAKKLSGAVFILTDIEDTDKTTTVTTDTNGQIVLLGTGQGMGNKVPLIQGHTYTLQEKEAPTGYKLNNTVLEFTVNTDGTVTFTENSMYKGNSSTVITVTNELAEFALIKKDAQDDSRLLQNAEFKLSRKTGETTWEEVVAGIKTGRDGKIVFKTGNKKSEGSNDTYILLTHDAANSYQIYKLEETTATLGYELAKSFTFRLNADGTVTDIDKGGNADGVIALSSDAQSNSTLTVKDNKTALRLNKVDTGNNNSDLSSNKLTLTVTDANGKQVFTWSRSERETIVSVNTALYATIEYDSEADLIYGLPVGTYQLQETATPLGYVTAKSVSFVMKDDGTIAYANDSDADSKEDSTIGAVDNEYILLTIGDEPIRGHVQLTKTLNGNGLAGVTFNLYRVSKSGVNPGAASETEDILIASGITTGDGGVWTSAGSSIPFDENSGETGTLSRGLPSGSYYFVETATTSDAALDSTSHVGAFTIGKNENGTMTAQPDDATVTVTNDSFAASVELTKYDVESSLPIAAGVSFTLTRTDYSVTIDASNQTKDTYAPGNSGAYCEVRSVDKDGKIRFENLTKGTYVLEENADPTGYENGADNKKLFKATFEIRETDNGKTLVVNSSNSRFTKERGEWNENGVLNTPKTADVILYKKGKTATNSTDSVSLKGVQFELQRKTGESVTGESVFESWMPGLTTGYSYEYSDTKVTNQTQLKGTEITGEVPLKITGLKWGTYRLVETYAKDGYSVVDSNGKTVSVEFTVDQTTDFTKPITFGTDGSEIFNYYTKLRIAKKSSDGTENLEGAVFTITGRFADNPLISNAVREFTTGANGELAIAGLLIGNETYTLTETVPPAGYELLGGTVTFAIGADGKTTITQNSSGYDLTSADSFDNLITVADNRIQVRLEKYSDEDPAVKLTGAKFTVTPENTSETFADGTTRSITLTDANMSTGLEGMVIAGHSYKVTETKAPDGYRLAADFIFTVKNDGSVQIKDQASHRFVAADNQNGIAVIKVTDSKNQLVISKTNENSQQLPAEVMAQVRLRITDVTNVTGANAGTVVMNLTTTPGKQDPYTYDLATSSWTIEGQLIQNHTYRLEETGVPDNYLIAEPIEFTMGTDGKITVKSGAVQTSQAGQISSEDTRANNLYLAGEQGNFLTIRDTEVKGSLTITKEASGTAIANVEFEFYRLNADGTSELIQNKATTPAANTWTTGSDGKLTVDGLSVGNYYFKEIKADGYAYDSGKVYRVNISKSANNEKIVVTYGEGFKASAGKTEPVIENTKTVLTVKKVDGSGMKLDSKYMAQVELTLTDQTDFRTLTLKVPDDSSSDDVNDASYVTYDADEESWTITGWLIQGHTYVLTETKTPYEYRTATEITFKLGEKGALTDVENAYANTSDSISVSDKKIVGKITLTKTLKNGSKESALEGVVFDLYRDGSIYRSGLTTNVSGQIVAENLPEGTYYFVEKTAPDNVYMDGEKTAEVTIDGTVTDEVNLTRTVAKIDAPFETKVDLVKVEENEGHTTIPGTEFTLSKLDENGDPISEKTTTAVTGADGKATFVINEAGTYQVKETKPAYGYENSHYTAIFEVSNTADFQGFTLHLADKKENCSVSKEEAKTDGTTKTTSGSVENYKLSITSDIAGELDQAVSNARLTGAVTLTKKDVTDPGNPVGLEGITFTLYKKGTQEDGSDDANLGDFLTGKNGVLKISSLEWGSYYLKETKADGYQLDGKTYPFTIGKDYEEGHSGIAVDLGTISNEQNQIEIAKAAKDAKGNEYLEGAGFTLTKPDGSTESWVSGSTPKVFRKLAPGKYTLTETKAPAGYIISDPVTFTVNTDGTVTDKAGNKITDNLVIMKDTPNMLTIKKTDDNNTALSNEALEKLELKLEDTTSASELKKLGDTKLTADQTLNAANLKNGVWTLTGVLLGGHTYTLTETRVPTGYLIADPIQFTMGTDGVIQVKSGADAADPDKTADKVTAGRINNLYIADASSNELQVRDTQIKATVTITKQDSEADASGTHKKLENVEFKFYRQNSDAPDLSEATKDTLIKNGTEETWETNADGEITITDLSEGTYYFREVKADGYIYDSNAVYPVIVGKTDDGKTIQVCYGENSADTGVLENTQNVLTVKKVDGEGNTLSEESMEELELTITDVTESTDENPGTELVKLTTKANDRYTYDPETAAWTLKGQLIAGHTYKLEETGRPYGYLVADPITFTMKEDGTITNVKGASDGTANSQNTGTEAGKTNLYTLTSLFVRDVTVRGSLKLTKSGADGEGLKGVTFDLYRVNGSEKAVLSEDKLKADPDTDEKVKSDLVTDGNGEILVTDLPEGSYYFKETGAPSGVYMDGGVTRIVTINQENHGKVLEVTKEDTDFTTGVQLVKKDSTNKATIEGTRFTLYKEEKTKDGKGTEFKEISSTLTGKDGKAGFTLTSAGKYKVVEEEAAYGYENSHYTAVFEVSNTADFQGYTLYLADKKETCSVSKEETKADGITKITSGNVENYKLSITSDIGEGLDGAISNTRLTGEVTLTKQDVTDPGNPVGLEGITFTLYKKGTQGDGSDDVNLGDFLTGKDGVLKISGLEWGSYYLKETKADKYQLDVNKEYPFTISNDTVNSTGLKADLGTITNKQNQLTITKIDQDGTALGKAVLDNPDVKDEVIKDLELTITDITKQNGAEGSSLLMVLKPQPASDGEYTFDEATTTWTVTGKLIQGHTYQITETGRPYGYGTASPITFTMGKDGKITVLEDASNMETAAGKLNIAGTTNLYTDTAIAIRDSRILKNLSLTKTSEDGESLVEGAEFTLYRMKGGTQDPSTDEVRGTFTTDGNGTLEAENLPEGKYYFVETKAPADKVLDPTPTKVLTVSETSTEEDLSVTVKNEDLHYTVELTKKDETDKSLLSGVTFALYEVTGQDAEGRDILQQVGEAQKTGADGKVTFNITKAGTYRIKETASIYGYLFDKDHGYTSDKFTVENTSAYDDGILELTAENTREAGTVTLYKEDGESETALNGITFTLYYRNPSTKADEKVLDAVTGKSYTRPAGQTADQTAGQTADQTAASWLEEAGEDGVISITGLAWGDYYVVETKADGYELKDTKYGFTIGNAKSEKSGISVDLLVAYNKIVNYPNKLNIAKVDADGNLLGGAQLKLTGPNGYEHTWTSSQIQAEELKRLAPGSYTLTETSRPYGYLVADPITFTMKEDGTITNVTGASQSTANSQDTVNSQSTEATAGSTNLYTLNTLFVRDLPIKAALLLNKKDADGNALAGAIFDLYQMKGTEPDTASDEKIKENLSTDTNGQILVEDLPEGTYYFAETFAPEQVFMDGKVTETATIDSESHGKTLEIEKVNEAFHANVELKKADADTGNAIADAEFTLYIKNGDEYEEVERMETDENGKAEFILSQAGSYQVVETRAAYGYDYDAKNPYTAEFTVTNTADFQNTTLQLSDSVAEEIADKYGITITGNLSADTTAVVNQKTPDGETGSITVTKYLMLLDMPDGIEIGTKDSVFYTALFTDPEGTRRYSEVKELRIQDGVSASVTFDGLPKGTYYVFETYDDGTPIPYDEVTLDAAGNKFYCTGVGTEEIQISPQQKNAEAELYNVYSDLPDGYYMNGKLEVTKNVLRNGEKTETNDTFYAGIFDEDGELVQVVQLVQNDTVTVRVKLGGEKGTEPVDYIIEETDEEGNPVDESFPYEVEVNGSGYVSREEPIAQTEITNIVKESEPENTPTPTPQPSVTITETPQPTVTVTETPQPENPGTGGDTPGGNTGTPSVKTGDETPTEPFVVLLLLSGCALIFVTRKRRKSA